MEEPAPGPVPGRVESKPKRSCGCSIVLFCMGLAVVGVVVAIIFKPDTAVKEVQLSSDENTYSVVETVSPDTFNKVAVKLNLLGKRYHVRSHTNRSTGSSRRRTTHTNHLAYEIPIAVKITRTRDDEVILDHRHVFELEDYEKNKVSNKKLEFEELGIFVGEYPGIPELDQAEELKVELTLEKDTKYESRLQSGTLAIEQKDKSAVQSIAILMVILGVLVGTLFSAILVVKFIIVGLVKSHKAPDGPARQNRNDPLP